MTKKTSLSKEALVSLGIVAALLSGCVAAKQPAAPVNVSASHKPVTYVQNPVTVAQAQKPAVVVQNPVIVQDSILVTPNTFVEKNSRYNSDRFDHQFDRFTNETDKMYIEMMRDYDKKMRNCERGSQKDCRDVMKLDMWLQTRQYYR